FHHDATGCALLPDTWTSNSKVVGSRRCHTEPLTKEAGLPVGADDGAETLTLNAFQRADPQPLSAVVANIRRVRVDPVPNEPGAAHRNQHQSNHRQQTTRPTGLPVEP